MTSTGANQGGGSHDEAGEQERPIRLTKDDGQTAIDETEAAAQCRGVPGHAGEISTKTVCFNSQPEFAPSQKTLSDDESEKTRCGIPTGDLKASPPRPRSILKSFENPSIGSRAAVGSNPLESDGACLGSVIECISSASEPEPSPPPANRKPNPGTLPPPSAGSRQHLPGSPARSSSSSPSSDRQEVDVTPPNSPSVLASIGKSSQAKPKSNKRYLKTLPKAQWTRGLSSSFQSNLLGHITRSNTNLDQTSSSKSQLSIYFKIPTKHHHLD